MHSRNCSPAETPDRAMYPIKYLRSVINMRAVLSHVLVQIAILSPRKLDAVLRVKSRMT